MTSPMSTQETQARYQPVIEIAQAYQALPADVAHELQDCFDGNRNFAEHLDTARRIVHTTAPEALSLVVARLIHMADDTVDIDTTAELPPQSPPVVLPLVQQVRTALSAIPADLRDTFMAVQTRDIDLERIAEIAQRVTQQLAPRDMWRVLAGQLLVTAADNQLMRARAAVHSPQPHGPTTTNPVVSASAASLDAFAARGDTITRARAHALALPLNTPRAQVEAALDERLRGLIARIGAADLDLLKTMQRAVMVETLDMCLHSLRCCSDVELISDVERLLAVAHG